MISGARQLRTRTSAGDSDSFGKTSELPAQAIKEYEHAVNNGLNLAGVGGSLNWFALRSRPDIAWAVSRAARMVTKQPKLPSVAYHRFKHIGQYLRWSMDLGLRFNPLSENEKSKMW
eukprot:1709163-Amphidinium_carterae.1